MSSTPDTDAAAADELSLPFNREELSAALIELNSKFSTKAIILTHEGKVRTGVPTEPECRCVLLTTAELARQLNADGLSSYTGSELNKWVAAYDVAPLLARIEATIS